MELTGVIMLTLEGEVEAKKVMVTTPTQGDNTGHTGDHISVGTTVHWGAQMEHTTPHQAAQESFKWTHSTAHNELLTKNGEKKIVIILIHAK